MANFDALFAGCESFMEGDVEINNDVTVPGSEGDALEAESVAEDVGTEGGEIAGEAETEDTKAEAANMVFDQLINMYMHVKRYGVDRTFLSLYNSNGELNRMISYRFPGIESIDSVGSPRSQASRAFIIAMEEDGIWKRIWTWIKETAVKVYNFFIKVMDWFREACGNLDMRVGKLYKYFSQSAPKKWGEIKDKNIKYIEKGKRDSYTDKRDKAVKELSQGLFNYSADYNKELGANNVKFKSGKTLTETIANAATAMSTRLKDISAHIMSESTRTTEKVDATNPKNYGPYSAYGSTKDKDDKDGVEALKKYIDRINKDVIDPLEDAISDLSFETRDLNEVTADDAIFVSLSQDKYTQGIHMPELNVVKFTKPSDDNNESADTIKKPVLNMLDGCKKVLIELLQQKQAMQMMELANKQSKQAAEQASRLAGNGSQDYEAHKDAKLSMMGIVKANSIFARINTLNEKVVAKCCTLAAGLQSCVKPNGA